MENVVLVDSEDNVLGVMEKLEAHQKGVLHRAFSVFIFNSDGEMLLQQRSALKYHSPNKWTNACCSHPRENESYINAANRRLYEELGIKCSLKEKFHFIYKAKVEKNLWEHELDYVFTGQYNGNYQLNKDEVADIRFVSIEELNMELEQKSEIFTEWFKIIWKKYNNKLFI